MWIGYQMVQWGPCFGLKNVVKLHQREEVF